MKLAEQIGPGLLWDTFCISTGFRILLVTHVDRIALDTPEWMAFRSAAKPGSCDVCGGPIAAKEMKVFDPEWNYTYCLGCITFDCDAVFDYQYYFDTYVKDSSDYQRMKPKTQKKLRDRWGVQHAYPDTTKASCP